jgi:hypothetical protein
MIRDGNKLIENRNAADPRYLAQFAGNYVAWNDDCTKILAHSVTEADLYAEMDRLGLPGAECVIDFVEEQYAGWLDVPPESGPNDAKPSGPASEARPATDGQDRP